MNYPIIIQNPVVEGRQAHVFRFIIFKDKSTKLEYMGEKSGLGAYNWHSVTDNSSVSTSCLLAAINFLLKELTECILDTPPGCPLEEMAQKVFPVSVEGREN